MIRRDKNGGWILIAQHDHAGLSGQIMTHWGNSEFVKPSPYDEVLYAVKEHDSGWKLWDSLPKINPDSGYPANFTEMSFDDQCEIWTKCYNTDSDMHKYACSLIALHFSKFNRNNLRKDPENEILKNLENEMKLFVTENLDINITNGSLEEIPDDVGVNLKLLQIGDIISLALCHGWKSIEITDVPLNYNGSQTTLKMDSEDGYNYTISPYPFDDADMEFQILGKELISKKFADDNELRENLINSKQVSLDFRIRKG